MDRRSTSLKDMMGILDPDKYNWDYTITTIMGDQDIDIIYGCPHCKKKIGLESRFIEEGKQMICPYCDGPIEMTGKKKDGQKHTRSDIQDTGPDEASNEEGDGETTAGERDVS